MDSAVVAGCWALNLKQKKRRQHTHTTTPSPKHLERQREHHSFIHSPFTRTKTHTNSHTDARKRARTHTLSCAHSYAHSTRKAGPLTSLIDVWLSKDVHKFKVLNAFKAKLAPGTRVSGLGFRIQGSGLRVNAECLAGRTGPWCLSVFLDVSCFRLPRACTPISLLCN